MSSHWTQMPVGACEVCGGPVRSEYGVCLKTDACRVERFRRASVIRCARRKKATQPCPVCGDPTRSKYGVCSKPGPCLAEYQRLAAGAARLRTDRPCRDGGC